jgi:O-acetyl-ADP-ribose deacetylase (regulator of RNase III)
VPLQIEIVKGDITQVDTEVIVNAANNRFWMGSGVAGAIRAAGGEVIEEEAMAHGTVLPGVAIMTGAGKLPFKAIFHAAVMGQDLRTRDTFIRQATIACLNLAEQYKIRSIAFPAFGTGVGGFPITACANLMIGAVRAMEPRLTSLERVVFCLFDDVTWKVFHDAFARKSGG